MKYLPQLDGLRALAVILVFMHHGFHVPLVWMGVDLFFILSGYLITSILLRDRDRKTFGAMLGSFYIRRGERIMPAYVVALAFIWFFFAQDWKHLWPFYAFFLQNVPYAAGSVNGPLVPLWSLAIEQHFYLLWPVLVYFSPRSWLKWMMLAILFAEPVIRALCTPLFDRPEPIYALTPFRLDAMAAGALAALVLPHCNARRAVRWAQVAMAVAAIAYLALGMHPWFRRTANTPAFNGLAYSLNILLLGGFFVYVVLEAESPLVRLLSQPVLRGLGRISYMFYLLHVGILELVAPHFPGIAGPLVGFAVTAAAATLSWFALERPILSLSAGHRRAAPKTPVVHN